ncbi:unnamed protein product, partial [Rotaria sordida]
IIQEINIDFIENSEQQDILLNKINDELDSTSMINNEERTVNCKLAEQCISNPYENGTIKSNDQSSISIKYVILICLSHLTTL